MRVALDGKGLGDLDAAGARDAADVVAGEVDEHEVLGALLRVGQQLFLHAQVELGRGAARAGAGDRADRDLRPLRRVLVAHQDLGRRADDLELAHVVEVHVRRRVEGAQRPVQRQRRFGEPLGQPLADLHLHHVAGGDVLLGDADRVQVVVLRELALDGIGGAALDRRGGDAEPELVAELREAALGAEVRLGLSRVGIDDEVEAAGQVVDDGQLLGVQQQDVGRVEAAGLLGGGQPGLDVAHGVVAEVAGQAAAKARQAGPQRDLEAGDVGGDEHRAGCRRASRPPGRR